MAETAIRVTPLSGPERKRLGAAHPELREGESAMVVSGSENMVSAVEEFVESIARQTRQSEKLLEVLMEDVGTGAGTAVLEGSRVLQLQKLAEARDRFLREFPTLSSQQVAEINGSTARNAAALANRWKSEGKIFALPVGRAHLYPAFQFDEEGRPLPVVARVIEVFTNENPWTLALWFVGNSGWLRGKRPVDLLRTEPAVVVEAARRTMEPLSI